MSRVQGTVLLLALAGIVGMATGCKHTDAAKQELKATQPATGSGSAKVIYRPNVHVVEQEQGMKAIQGISTNGAALLLDATDQKIASLKAGDVLVIKGLIAKKIVASEMEEGNTILVLTQQASLTDAIENGQIQVSAPIRFGGMRAASESPLLSGSLMDWLCPPVYAQSPDGEVMNKAESKGTQDALGNVLSGIKGAVIEGWTTDFSTTPGDGKLNITLSMKKSVGGMIATINGDGSVSNFDFTGAVDVEQSKFEKIDSGLKNLNGAMNFKWEVATDTPGAHTGDDRIKLPAAISIPLYRYLDGLPLYLEISSALIIKPALSGGKEYSRGAFRISFEGYQHFSAAKGNMDSDGNVSGDIQFVEGQNISALAPMGMVVAFAAPRIELSFGISKILPFSDIKDAAEKVDKLADLLAKKALSPDQYSAFKSSPLGNITISKAVEMATKSDAAAYFEMVSSAGMSFTGVSAITPCTRHDIHLWGKVGASAEAFGQNVGSSEKTIYEKQFTRIDPPGTKLCEEVGKT
ncbi:MAG: hypothetical protein ABSF17_09330 [Terracidiphilus sp.]